jgi:hypothetical protein
MKSALKKSPLRSGLVAALSNNSRGKGAFLTALVLCGLSVLGSAQNHAVSRVAREQGFTIPPNVQTPIVLKTRPDAACDLRAAGAVEPAHTLRLYSNADGYVRVLVSAKQENQPDTRVQLDCAASGKVITYPVYLRVSSFPSDDMPAPRAVMPAPKGSTIRPALSESQAQSMSDDDLARLAYPERPDALAEPDRYAKWMDRVSRPMTMLPAHLLSTSVTATPANRTSSNWSGLEAHNKNTHHFSAVTADWVVPPIGLGSPDGNPDYSSFWVGLDGDGTKDLVQAGTEQDAQLIGGTLFTNYYAWSELLPNQPTENFVFSVNAGDKMEVEVWIGNGSGPPDPNGSLGSFRITDVTQGQEARFDTALDGTKYNGTEAEWIMERPRVGGSLPELAAYLIANMENAAALNAATVKWVKSGNAANRNISMWNGKDELSLAIWLGKGTDLIPFNFLNFQ